MIIRDPSLLTSQSARPLSPVENIFWRLSDASPLNCTMVIRVRGPLSVSVLQGALDAAQLRHPLLQVRIEATPSGPVYRTDDVGPIPVQVACGGPPANDWSPLAESEINRPLPTALGPLARSLIVSHSADLHDWYLTLHHVIADGYSLALLVRDTLQAAAGRDLEPLPDVTPMDLRLPPCSTGLRGWWNRAKLIIRMLRQKRRYRSIQRTRVDSQAAPHERRTRIFPMLFDTDFTRALVERARRENTTVHGTLSAAMCLAVARDVGGDDSVSFRFRSPINMRDQIVPPAGEDVGLYASMLLYRNRISCRDDVWTLARDIRNQFASDTADGHPAIMMSLLPMLYQRLRGHRLTNEELAKRWREETPSTCGITNLGRLEVPPEYGPFRIESIDAVVGLSSLADFSGVALTYQGKLHWNFLCPEPTFTRSHAEELVAAIRERLEKAIGTAATS